MVYCYIYGIVVMIYIIDVIDIGVGYFSYIYISQYVDLVMGEVCGGCSSFKDSFVVFFGDGVWVLIEWVVIIEVYGDIFVGSQIFCFEDFELF